MHNFHVIVFAAALATGTALAKAATSSSISLFNGKDLSGWTTFVDPAAKVAPEDIWSVTSGTIVCKGQKPGYLLTEAEYENYVLHVEWRWGESIASGRNSGVFVHTSGPNKIWPRAVEAQLAAGHAGDFWLVDGFKMKIDESRHDPKSERHWFRTKDNVEKPIGEPCSR